MGVIMNIINKIKKVNELVRKDGVYIKEMDKDKKNPPLTVSAWSKIKYFRQVFGDELGFDTQLFVHENHYVAKCKIIAYDPERILATGHHKTFKNQGDHQACETLAISRALSFFGILESDITSLEEYNMLGVPITKESKDILSTKGVPVEQIVEELKKAPHETRLNHLRYHVYRPTFVETEKNHPKDFRLLDNAFKSRMNLITKQEKI